MSVAVAPTTCSGWDAQERAVHLVAARARLLSELPNFLADDGARGLTRDQREFVVDEAIDFVVNDYQDPIGCEQEAESVFWASARWRTKKAVDGRGNTVRGYDRVDIDKVELADECSTEELALRSTNWAMAMEFMATLTELESKIFSCAVVNGEPGRPLTDRPVSRMLGLDRGVVRSANRRISRKLDQFAAIQAAGRMCETRRPAIDAQAHGSAAADVARLANTHLVACSPCRVYYKQLRRELEGREFQHRVSVLLPAPLVLAAKGGTLSRLLMNAGIRQPPPGTVPSGAISGVLVAKSATLLAAGAAAVTVAGPTAISIVTGPSRHPIRTSQPTHPTRAVAAPRERFGISVHSSRRPRFSAAVSGRPRSGSSRRAASSTALSYLSTTGSPSSASTWHSHSAAPTSSTPHHHAGSSGSGGGAGGGDLNYLSGSSSSGSGASSASGSGASSGCVPGSPGC